jgi:hypothetical protein
MMGGLRRHDSPTGVHSPKTSKVGFAGVTGISRPVNKEEHWTLYYFEAHAAECRTCFNPLSVYKAGKQLCDKGHQLAIDVARHIFYRKDGEVYSRVKDGEQEVRVEIPHGYEQTLYLLTAIQRALKKGEQFIKHKSHDRTYLVEPRIPNERVKRDREHRERETEEAKQTPRKQYDTVIVEPSSPPRPRRHERESQEKSTDSSKRGSLYGYDMGELERLEKREKNLRYNLEVREPSFKSHRRYSTFS